MSGNKVVLIESNDELIERIEGMRNEWKMT